MYQLLVRSLPKKDQSMDCYLNALARENGYRSVELMFKQYLNVIVANVDQVSLKMVGDLTGHGDVTLQNIGLLPSEQHFQPTHWYGKLAIPSYHLRKEQWICPHCVNERNYSLSRWRIAWLPICLKHRKPLVQAEKLNWREGLIIDFGKAANDELYDHRLLEIQQVLEVRLEAERNGITGGEYSESVLDFVERHLFRSISETKVNHLMDRRRKYSRRYFPIPNKDIPKFMECLFTQLIE